MCLTVVYLLLKYSNLREDFLSICKGGLSVYIVISYFLRILYDLGNGQCCVYKSVIFEIMLYI